MGKPRPKFSYTTNNFKAARKVAVLCMRIAGRRDPDRYIDHVAEHIVSNLAPTFMRELVAGNWKRSQWAAMKLTLPYFKT